MMSYNRQSYETAEAWLEALCNDYLWITKRAEMEKAFATCPSSAIEKYRQEAFSVMDNGLVSCYWKMAPYKIQEIIHDIWEEHSLSLVTLKLHTVAMLMLEYIEQHSQEACLPQQGDNEANVRSSLPQSENTTQNRPLSVAIQTSQRRQLEAAERLGIIAYNHTRQGYDKGKLASQALVAYLCGRVFCGDYTKEGVWMEGKRFDEAKYCEQLFGFDVAGTRRKIRSSGAGKSPIGWKKIDELFN